MQATKDFVIKKREKPQFYLPRTKQESMDKSTDDGLKPSLSYRPPSKTKISIARSSNNIKPVQLGGSPRNLEKGTLSHRQTKTIQLPSPISMSGVESELNKQSSIEDDLNHGMRSNTFTDSQSHRLAQSPKFYTPTTKASSSIRGLNKGAITCFDSAAKIAIQTSTKNLTETSLNEK